MRIPFDIKYKPQIESGKYKVETEEGSPARIICWDSPINKERPIIAIVFDDQIEQYKADGHYDNDYETCNYDLFIVTPEEELTEFENRLCEILDSAINYQIHATHEGIIADAKKLAKKLLELAEKELEEEVPEMEFTPIENTLEYKAGFRAGKAEALKDLPRWKKDESFETEGSFMGVKGREIFVVKDGYSISVAELIEKLPGFKEDGHE